MPDRPTANLGLAYDKRFRVGRTGTNGRVLPAVLFLPELPLTNGWYSVVKRRVNGRTHHVEIHPRSTNVGVRRYVVVDVRTHA